MVSLSPWEWTLAAAAALCVGLAKAGFGGAGIIAILMMARVLPPRESTGAILPMLIIADLFAIGTFRKHVVWSHLVGLLPPAVLGIVSGWLIMPHIPNRDFGALVGWLIAGLIVLMVVQKLTRRLAAEVVRHPGIAWPTGWLAGVTTMLANAAGPVMTLYLLAARLPKLEFVGTAAWFFFIINLTKIPFSASMGLIQTSTLTLNAILAPAIIAGVFAGRRLLARINQDLFEWLMIVFSGFGALRLIAG